MNAGWWNDFVVVKPRIWAVSEYNILFWEFCEVTVAFKRKDRNIPQVDQSETDAAQSGANAKIPERVGGPTGSEELFEASRDSGGSISTKVLGTVDIPIASLNATPADQVEVQSKGRLG